MAAHTPPSEAPVTAEAAPLSATKQQQLARRARRLKRWEEIRQRRAAGQSISQIARELGIERKTVRRQFLQFRKLQLPDAAKSKSLPTKRLFR